MYLRIKKILQFIYYYYYYISCNQKFRFFYANVYFEIHDFYVSLKRLAKNIYFISIYLFFIFILYFWTFKFVLSWLLIKFVQLHCCGIHNFISLKNSINFFHLLKSKAVIDYYLVLLSRVRKYHKIKNCQFKLILISFTSFRLRI